MSNKNTTHGGPPLETVQQHLVLERREAVAADQLDASAWPEKSSTTRVVGDLSEEQLAEWWVALQRHELIGNQAKIKVFSGRSQPDCIHQFDIEKVQVVCYGYERHPLMEAWFSPEGHLLLLQVCDITHLFQVEAFLRNPEFHLKTKGSGFDWSIDKDTFDGIKRWEDLCMEDSDHPESAFAESCQDRAEHGYYSGGPLQEW